MNRIKELPIWNSMWETTDRRINVSSLLLAIVSIGLGLLTARNEIPEFIYFRDITIVILFAALFSIVLRKLFRAERELARLKTLLNGENIIFHVATNMVENYKDILFEKYYDPATMANIVEMNEDDDRAFKAVANHITIGVRNAIQSHCTVRGEGVDENIAVAIKSLVPTSAFLERSQFTEHERQKFSAKTEWLVTSYRDPETYHNHRRKRETSSAGYDVSKNSAFKLTLEDGEDFYLSNDLKGLGQNYSNENPNWNQFYNATVVVPIRFRRDVLGVDKYYGVLAADSLNRSKVELFDQDCVAILKHAADILSVFFLLLELLYDEEPDTDPSLDAQIGEDQSAQDQSTAGGPDDWD